MFLDLWALFSISSLLFAAALDIAMGRHPRDGLMVVGSGLGGVLTLCRTLVSSFVPYLVCRIR